MAAPIYVRTKELVVSDAKKASSCIEDAISAMSKVDNAVSGWDLYIDAAADGFVFAKSESEVGACLSALRAKQTQLEKLIAVMQTGTEKLEEADAGFKNEITDPNLWERLTNAVGRAIYSSTIGKVDALIVGVAWLGSLFAQDNAANQKVTSIDVNPIVNPAPPIVKEVAINSYHEWNGKGSIRYVSQNYNLRNNGWIASDGCNWTGKAGDECGYASQSMALSYVGVDFSPGDMCDGEYGHGRKWRTYWDQAAAYGHDVQVKSASDSGKNVKETIIDRVNDYKADAGMGAVSPVAIHYRSSTGQHSVLVIDYDVETGVFTAIDPASSSVDDAKRYFKMDNNGNIAAGSGMDWTGNGEATIDGNVQYIKGE